MGRKRDHSMPRSRGVLPTTYLKEASPPLDANGEPEWMPVLQEGDIVKGTREQSGKCCIGGWLNWTFRGNAHSGAESAYALACPVDGTDPAKGTPNKVERRLKMLLVDEANKVRKKLGVKARGYSLEHTGMPRINDGEALTYGEVAMVWNRAVRRMGWRE